MEPFVSLTFKYAFEYVEEQNKIIKKFKSLHTSKLVQIIDNYIPNPIVRVLHREVNKIKDYSYESNLHKNYKKYIPTNRELKCATEILAQRLGRKE